MTGFGSAEGNVLGGRLSIEIRSVNHRYYNPHLKLPFELGGVEGPLRERLRQQLERGHVTVSARWIEAPQRDGTVAVDLTRARQLVGRAAGTRAARGGAGALGEGGGGARGGRTGGRATARRRGRAPGRPGGHHRGARAVTDPPGGVPGGARIRWGGGEAARVPRAGAA